MGSRVGLGVGSGTDLGVGGNVGGGLGSSTDPGAGIGDRGMWHSEQWCMDPRASGSASRGESRALIQGWVAAMKGRKACICTDLAHPSATIGNVYQGKKTLNSAADCGPVACQTIDSPDGIDLQARSSQ